MLLAIIMATISTCDNDDNKVPLYSSRLGRQDKGYCCNWGCQISHQPHLTAQGGADGSGLLLIDGQPRAVVGHDLEKKTVRLGF